MLNTTEVFSLNGWVVFYANEISVHLLKIWDVLGMTEYVYNPIYMRFWGGKITILGHLGKSMRPYLKNTQKAKELGDSSSGRALAYICSVLSSIPNTTHTHIYTPLHIYMYMSWKEKVTVEYDGHCGNDTESLDSGNTCGVEVKLMVWMQMPGFKS
jgi:hypothetical protein